MAASSLMSPSDDVCLVSSMVGDLPCEYVMVLFVVAFLDLFDERVVEL